MLKLRSQMARTARYQGFFDMRQRAQQLEVASTAQEMLDKIAAIREVIRPLTRRDLKTIKRITGLREIRIEDILYSQREVKRALLSGEEDNI